MYLVIHGTLYHGTKCTTPKYHGSFSMVYVVPLVCNLPWSTSGVVFCIVESDDNTTCGRPRLHGQSTFSTSHSYIVDANKITNWEAAQVMKMLEI